MKEKSTRITRGLLFVLLAFFPVFWSKVSTAYQLSLAVNGMGTAIHESLCSLVAAFILLSTRNGSFPKWKCWLSVSFASVALADLMYGIAQYILRIPPPRGLIPLIHEFPYVVFSIALAISVVSRALDGLRGKSRVAIWTTIFVLGVLFGVCSYELILNPFFHAIPKRPFLIYTTATVYALAQSVAVGAMIIASLRALTLLEFGLWFSFLGMCASDFALRYQDIGGSIPAVSIFEYGWAMALAIMASLLMFGKWVLPQTFSAWKQAPAPLFSFRVIPAALTLAGLVLFSIALWVSTSFLGIATPGTAGAFILMFAGIWAIANFISILLSRNIHGVFQKLELADNNVPIRESALTWEVQRLFSFLRDRNSLLLQERDHVLKLTSGVAHNMRSPLLGLRTAVPRLAQAMNEPGPHQNAEDLIDLLSQSLRTIENTASDLLKDRKQVLHAEPIDASVRGATSLAALKYPDREFQVETKDVPSGQRVPGLSTALLNLLENAAEASEAGDTIRIKVGKDREGVQISVDDPGCGILQENVERLNRGEEFTTKSAGNGLGVSTVHRWATQHGYRFRLRSLGENKGARAELIIPA